MLSAIVIAAVLAQAQGALRTLDQRKDAGECATDNVQYPAEYLSDYRKLGSAIGDLDGTLTSAELIEIDYGTNFKVLTEKYAKEQYILIQCGTTQPSNAQIDEVKALPSDYTRKFFTIPLQQVNAESTVQLAFLETLGVEDRVSYVSQYAVSPCWQKSISCGGLAADSYSNATLMAQQRDLAEAFFADCPWDYATNAPDCAALNAMPKAVHFSASQDPGPLHSAEHVKFMAAFFNKEQEAMNFFNSKVSAIAALSEQSSALSDGDKPLVAWIEKSWDGSIKLSTADYQKAMVEMAGGKVVDEATMNAANDDLNAVLKTVDAVVDLTYSSDPATYDFDQFLSNFGYESSSDIPFIKNKKVFRVDAQISGASNLDWFESRLPHPDMAIKGLQRVLKPDDTQPKKFFRNIAIGEAVEVLDKDACTKTPMKCLADEYASPVPVLKEPPGQVSLAADQFVFSSAMAVSAVFLYMF